ncbi:hypothetical protein EWM62_08685 [Mucilaginibacter terrigena]|uniref:Nuclear transport factor 2 family protein n=1 Tax=Mucilaginibacter terrigena TaxID=2492395 RepID=A0A4Q5LN66_9SPHI|nr:hypothetical protein [Mucilaginibacter terrigena]RYU90712.1 hypothetical protein EWM62_08685 [Mucilaginibacter terrigena]
MKQILLLAIICIVFAGCKQTNTAGQPKTDTTAKLSYPFKPKYSINWEKGDEKNALIVLNCLKKYVDGDIKGATEGFADTVTFMADNFSFTGKKDSLVKIISQMRGDLVTVSKEFESWMTTYYPDKKDTWVTLWYMEKWTDKRGKTDSLYYTDDVLLKNGKIVLYDEKIRHNPAPVAKM